METTDANAVVASFSYGNDLISMKRADANSYYHYDGLGSTRQLTGSTGAVSKSYTYDSFGNLIASSGTSDNTYGFTGEQQFDEADNLMFLRARYYSPSIGRFISRDPIGYKGGINVYAYVNNNPVNKIDPLGLRSVEECRRKYRNCKLGCKADFACDWNPGKYYLCWWRCYAKQWDCYRGLY